MRAAGTDIDGLFRIDVRSVTDQRGTVREFFRASAFAELGVASLDAWSQINVTWTRRGAIRGLHGEAMTKLVGVAAGEAFGVYLDTRKRSSTFGRVVTVPLRVGTQVLVPPGVCNGFQATSDDGCEYLYCFDAEWKAGMAGVDVNPLDPGLDISWPISVDPGDRRFLSEKDAFAPFFDALYSPGSEIL